MNTFSPPALFRNPHVQSIAASIKLRRPLVRGRAAAMLRAGREMIVDAGDGVRLQGFYSPQPNGSNKGLVILIHGWEGSSDSMCLVSSAGHLSDQGLNVFRLNLRDHGESHHLNPGFFHSWKKAGLSTTATLSAKGKQFNGSHQYAGCPLGFRRTGSPGRHQL